MPAGQPRTWVVEPGKPGAHGASRTRSGGGGRAPADFLFAACVGSPQPAPRLLRSAGRALMRGRPGRPTTRLPILPRIGSRLGLKCTFAPRLGRGAAGQRWPGRPGGGHTEVRRAAWAGCERWGKLAGSFREAGRKLAGSFREAGGKLAGSFREAGGKLAGTLRDGSGTVRGRFEDDSRTIRGRRGGESAERPRWRPRRGRGVLRWARAPGGDPGRRAGPRRPAGAWNPAVGTDLWLNLFWAFT